MSPSLNPNHNRRNQLLQAWTVYVWLTIKGNWGKSLFGCSFQSCGDVVKLKEYLSDFHQCFLAYCSFKLQAATLPRPPSARLQLPSTRNLLPPSVFFYCPITFNICTPSCLWFTMRRIMSPYVADIIIMSNNPQKTPTPPQGRVPVEIPQVPYGSVAFTDTVNAWSWCAWRFWTQRAWPEVPMVFVITGGVSRVSRLSRWQQPIHFYLILFCLPSVFYLIFLNLWFVWFFLFICIIYNWVIPV